MEAIYQNQSKPAFQSRLQIIKLTLIPNHLPVSHPKLPNLACYPEIGMGPRARPISISGPQKDLSMSSLRQVEANRLNSQKSTGPRSAEGKTASSMNALKSGIDAQSNIIRGENAAGLEALTKLYYQECQPSTALEQFYVDILIRNDWQLRRMERVDAEYWEYRLEGYSQAMPGCELGRAWNGGSPAFARIQRRKNDIQRSTILARQELLKLQAERPTDPPPQPADPEAIHPPIGFVPESVGQAPSPAPDPLVRLSEPSTQPIEKEFIDHELGSVPQPDSQHHPPCSPPSPVPGLASSNPPTCGYVEDSHKRVKNV